MARLTPDARHALLPAAGLPLLYFLFAHACLAFALATLAVNPAVSSGFFFHPRMVALVHLVTLGWITGSILGAFYIVGPLVLRIPLRPGWLDRAALAVFVAGVLGMSQGFWNGDYSRMAVFATLAIAGTLHVALRAWRGLPTAKAPSAVKLLVALAFVNIVGAGIFGMIVGLNRVYGWLPWSPEHAAYAHAHVAAIGWAVMMVVGIGYRLVPMVLPAPMPEGRSLLVSAILLQSGVIVLGMAVRGASAWSVAGALLAAAGLAIFIAQLASVARRRLPPPASLPRPDWATRQTRFALVMLVVTVICGLLLFSPARSTWRTPLAWAYGVLGLIGFLSQMVIGIQGRLLPLHGWFREFEALGSQQPQVSAHERGSQPFTLAIFLFWLAGVPALAAGFALNHAPTIRAGALALLAGVLLNVAHGAAIVKESSRPIAR